MFDTFRYQKYLIDNTNILFFEVILIVAATFSVQENRTACRTKCELLKECE